MHIDIEIQVEQLLNIEEQGILANRIAQVTDERVLYLLGHNYNWDDGFETPKEILSNPYRKVTHGGIEHGNNTGS